MFVRRNHLNFHKNDNRNINYGIILTLFDRAREYRDDNSAKLKRETLRMISSIGPLNPRILKQFCQHRDLTRTQKKKSRVFFFRQNKFKYIDLNLNVFENFNFAICL